MGCATVGPACTAGDGPAGSTANGSAGGAPAAACAGWAEAGWTGRAAKGSADGIPAGAGFIGELPIPGKAEAARIGFSGSDANAPSRNGLPRTAGRGSTGIGFTANGSVPPAIDGGAIGDIGKLSGRIRGIAGGWLEGFSDSGFTAGAAASDGGGSTGPVAA
jgi:hypothetical protein